MQALSDGATCASLALANLLAFGSRSDRLPAPLREAQSAAGFNPMQDKDRERRSHEGGFMIAVLIVSLAVFCMVLYRFAIYVVPLYLGIAAGVWAFEHDAGIGSIAIGTGIATGVVVLARSVAATGGPALRLAITALFAGPAAYTAFEIVEQLGVLAIPSSLWRHLFAMAGAFAVGAASAVRIAPVGESRERARRYPARISTTGRQSSD